MKKIALLMTLLLLGSTAQATDWEVIASIGDEGDIGYATYIDLDSIQKVRVADLEPVPDDYTGEVYVAYQNKSLYREEGDDRALDFYLNSTEYVSCPQWRSTESATTMSLVTAQPVTDAVANTLIKPKQPFKMQPIISSTINADEARYACIFMGLRDAESLDPTNSQQMTRLQQSYPLQFDDIVQIMAEE
jgi:hypothetical protein